MAVDYKTNPGVFDKTVVLYKEVTKQDSESGAVTSIWHPFTRVAAAVEPLAGRDYWNAVQTQAESNVRVTIRYKTGIPSRLRIEYDTPNGSVLLELKSPPINYGEKNEYLELMCRRYEETSPTVGSEGGILGGGSE